MSKTVKSPHQRGYEAGYADANAKMAAFLKSTTAEFERKLASGGVLVSPFGNEPPLPFDRGVFTGAIVASKTLLMVIESKSPVQASEPAIVAG